MKKKYTVNNSEKYIENIIRLYPNITSGRKNYHFNYLRIVKNIKLIKKYFDKKNIDL